MVYLHARSLSPDPLYDQKGEPLQGGFYEGLDIYPHAMARAYPENSVNRHWAESLNLFKNPGEVSIKPDLQGTAGLVLDFGTELEGELEVGCTVAGCCNIYVSFGESLPEAEIYGIPGTVPVPVEHWHLPEGGCHSKIFPSRGFRFVRIMAHDLTDAASFTRICVHARFAFQQGHLGDFICSDPLLQRIWHSSAYTARLCAREDALWDGVKRDRLGWYGDARITQQAIDCVFYDSGPAEKMLLRLPVDAWANGIPAFSFDAAAMLKNIMLVYGLEKACIAGAYKRIRGMLNWAKRTQTDSGGFLVRNSRVQYFMDIGFLDWSPMPVGGRFEELSWLQLKYLEALRNVAEIAVWLGERNDAARFGNEAGRLAKLIARKFWRDGKGYIHTLSQAEKGWKMLWESDHYRRTYLEKQNIGESGPSRHANALSVWAGACRDEHKEIILKILNDPAVPLVISGYFAYYEQCARAEAGDPAGALRNMRDYFGKQLEENDSATIWETYEPGIRDFRKWGLGAWPKSLCHGWSSGTVPFTARYLLGIKPVQPGFSAVEIRPASEIALTYEASVPTPFGFIEVKRKTADGRICYTVPRKIQISGDLPPMAVVEQY